MLKLDFQVKMVSGDRLGYEYSGALKCKNTIRMGFCILENFIHHSMINKSKFDFLR